MDPAAGNLEYTATTLYFTAGINGEQDGLLGAIKPMVPRYPSVHQAQGLDLMRFARGLDPGPAAEKFFIPFGNQTADDASYQECRHMTDVSFDNLVKQYYEPLYRFAFSLARTEADACDLTQQTFYVWATKGHQLRDQNRIKTWLFTTLHRVFLQSRRRETRFPHEPLSETEDYLPYTDPIMAEDLDCGQVLDALGRIEERYQAAVALFYLQECSYREIAEILEVPVGTVKSRLARGLGQLKKIFAQTAAPRRIEKAENE